MKLSLAKSTSGSRRFLRMRETPAQILVQHHVSDDEESGSFCARPELPVGVKSDKVFDCMVISDLLSFQIKGASRFATPKFFAAS